MGIQATNTDGAQSTGEQEQQGQDGADNRGTESGAKRDPLYENLPDDHPLVVRHEQLKAEKRAKAKLVEDAEEAKKVAAQKIADLTKEVEGVPAAVAASIRGHLVELHGFDEEDVKLFLTGDTPELLLQQFSRLLEKSGGAKRGNHVPREGTQITRPKPDATREFLHALTGEGQ